MKTLLFSLVSSLAIAQSYPPQTYAQGGQYEQQAQNYRQQTVEALKADTARLLQEIQDLQNSSKKCWTPRCKLKHSEAISEKKTEYITDLEQMLSVYESGQYPSQPQPR